MLYFVCWKVNGYFKNRCVNSEALVTSMKRTKSIVSRKWFLSAKSDKLTKLLFLRFLSFILFVFAVHSRTFTHTHTFLKPSSANIKVSVYVCMFHSSSFVLLLLPREFNVRKNGFQKEEIEILSRRRIKSEE